MGASGAPSDQFILCGRGGQGEGEGEGEGEGGEDQGQSPAPGGCFIRRFVVPLRQASADFDLDDLHDGRIDVGCRCLVAALFRSQSLRHNTEVRLCLLGEKAKKGASWKQQQSKGAVVAVSGGLARDMRADEAFVAGRIRRALDAACSIKHDPNAAGAGARAPAHSEGASEEMSTQKKMQMEILDSKLRRGFRCLEGGLDTALSEPLSFYLPRSAPGDGNDAKIGGGEIAGRLLFVKLDPAGQPLADFLKDLRERDIKIREFITILGDNRGLTSEDEATARKIAEEAGEELHSVSLGGQMLLASHSIVLVQHYLDLHLHMCPCKLWDKPGREVVKRRKQTQRKRAKLV
jgi:tRNA pseudouridine-54 N-methylase